MSATAKASFRRIVICLDGTNNEPGLARTNVQRIYGMVERIPDQQLTYYQPGVGTLEPIGVLSRLWRRVLMGADSAGGWMMQRHVCAAYDYLCDTYQPGDEIYLFGFSRGAQSARILAGMIAAVGVLHPGMREMVAFAWRTYTFWSPFSIVTSSLSKFGMGPGGGNKREYFDRAKRFKKHFSRPANITFMGLWDTVGSVGMPWNPRIYHFTSSNSSVEILRHALSVDEHRMSFEPNLWVKNPPSQDVKEVWFPGVHADVGGGYSGVSGETSKISLAWMIGELSATKIQLDLEAVKTAKLPNLADVRRVRKAACRSQHDEIKRYLWPLLEITPVPRWEQDRATKKWRFRCVPHMGSRRNIPDGSAIHFSVFARMEGNASYRPSNLPSTFFVA